MSECKYSQYGPWNVCLCCKRNEVGDGEDLCEGCRACGCEVTEVK